MLIVKAKKPAAVFRADEMDYGLNSWLRSGVLRSHTNETINAKH